MAAVGTANRWVLRYTGGPTRIIQAKTPITAEFAKRAYLKERCWKGTDNLDKDTEWKKCDPLADEDLPQYGSLLAVHPVVGKPLALIEV